MFNKGGKSAWVHITFGYKLQHIAIKGFSPVYGFQLGTSLFVRQLNLTLLFVSRLQSFMFK